MSNAVAIIAPEAGTLISPSARTLVVDVSDTDSNPARALRVLLNTQALLTRIGSSTTYLDPDFTLAVTTPESGVVRYTLTKSADWANPQNVIVDANYRTAGATPGKDAKQAATIAGALSLVSASPQRDQAEVSGEASVAVNLSATCDIVFLEASLNAVTALTYETETEIWSRPDFDGNISVAGPLASLKVDPRRSWAPDQTVQVALRVGVTVDETVTAYTTLEYAFHTRARRTVLASPVSQYTVLDRPLPRQPASEALRVTLVGALKAQVQSAPVEVLVYYRIAQSALGSLRIYLRRPDLDREVTNLVSEDLADPVAIAEALQGVDILWEPALREATNLGVNPLLLGLVSRSYEAPYAQERVGAVAMLLFLIAEIRPPFTA